MSATQPSIKITVGGVSVPVTDVIVCPLTGQLLLRSIESATKHGVVDTAPYVAKEIIISKDVTAGTARPITMVHPDVDPDTLR